MLFRSPFLEAAANGNRSEEIGVRARDTLVSYTQRLKGYLGEEERHDNVIRGRSCSLILSSDSELELSPMMCNVLVKPLPRENIERSFTKEDIISRRQVSYVLRMRENTLLESLHSVV